MIYNENMLIRALEESFKMYKLHGARSTAKLKPLHKFVAETLSQIFGSAYKLHFMGDNTKEKKVDGKYYPKKIDITVSKNEKPVFCLGIKFVTSNYKQNANNYFESMMGETANIRAMQIPYAQLIILRHETPYYKKNGNKKSSKPEIVNDKNIIKYQNLMFDQPQAAHRPDYLGIQLIDANERNGKVTVADLEKGFPETATFLKTKSSLANFFNEIETYKNFLEVKK